MHHSVRSRLRPLRHVVVVTVVAFAAVLLGVTSAAGGTTIPWEGNGAEGGFCNNVSGSGSQQTWHFVLTSPGPGPWDLEANFNTGTETDSGEQQGGGSVFFFVTTPAGAQLLSASATNGTANSVLTVSDCELSGGPPPNGQPPPSEEVTPPGPAAAPQPPVAVVGVARFTG